MKRIEVEKVIKEWKKKHNVRLYTPFIYFKGYTSKAVIIRRLNEMKRNKSKKDVSKIKFKTDKGMKTKKSKYHTLFEKRFRIPSKSGLEKKASVTGVPVSILRQVFRKGVAAWKTGHRPGTTAVQWGHARVDSFLTLGCAAYSADAYLLKKVKLMPENDKRKKFLSQRPSCPESKRKKYMSKKTGKKN